VTIHQKDLYIVPNGKLNGLHGEELGWYTGVFNAKTTDNLFKSKRFSARATMNPSKVLIVFIPPGIILSCFMENVCAMETAE